MVEIKKLNKGDLLIKEGDLSNSMFWLQSGSLRLFKKKGSGFIELGVVHSGEIIGEMSFLDNEPRSASAEVIQACDVVEIPRGKFEEFMASQPSWMKSLVATLVKRLRSANNRLRESETTRSVFVKDEDGRTTRIHEFITNSELMRLCASLLLCAIRKGEPQDEGVIKIRAGWLQIYAGQLMNVALAKLQVFTDILAETGMIRVDKQKDHLDIFLNSPDQLEKFTLWLNEENRKPADKQMVVSSKAIELLSAVHQHTDIGETSEEFLKVDMADVFEKACYATNQKIPFDLAVFPEVVTQGFAKDLRVEGTQKPAVFNVRTFQTYFPFLALRDRFLQLNLEKKV